VPTYEYRCPVCGRFEELQPITAPALEKCPKCGSPVTRIISGGAGIIFKGSGFYQTDYRGPEYSRRQKEESGGGTTTESGGGAKPEPSAGPPPATPPSTTPAPAKSGESKGTEKAGGPSAGASAPSAPSGDKKQG
jgi:putative FmdB family regulatory protein